MNAALSSRISAVTPHYAVPGAHVTLEGGPFPTDRQRRRAFVSAVSTRG